MKKQLLFAILLIPSFGVFAQNQLIKIKLVDKKNEPVVGSNVVIKERLDTMKVQFGSTDTAGIVVFTVENDKQLFVNATFVGFKPLQQGIVVSEKQTKFKFTLEEQAEILRGVEIVSKKLLIRQEDDKTVVDPEAIANTSTNALEVMEKTPGLFVDQDGNIYISSTTPANVYINGREQRMSNADIASMLKVLPPTSIEKIEILRTPSAKYDASSSGGLVNVILKKGVKIGLTGSVNAGANQGTYGNQFAGFSLNNNDGGKTSFMNFNYTKSNNYNKIINDRLLTSSILNQYSFTETPADALSFGYGIGRELTKKWQVNYDGRLSFTANNNATSTASSIKNTLSDALISNNQNTLQSKTTIFSLNQGAASVLKLDTLGSEFTTDVSYNYIQNDGTQDYATTFLLPQLNPLNGNGDITNKRHFFTAQFDVKYKLPRKITLETGAKTSFQDFKSGTAYFLSTQKDNFRTNTYNFKDNINAAYFQGSKKMGEFLLKVGTRLENTNMTGRQIVPSDTAFKVNRTDWFPYLYFSRKVVSIADFELRAYVVARRTIARPSYDNLNPFPRFLDQYLYESGNPNLKPKFTTNYEINISVNEMPLLAFGRNYADGIFENVVYQDPKNPLISYRTYDNLGKNTETYFKLLGGIPPGKVYFFVAGAQYNYNDYQGNFDNKPFGFKRGSWTFFTYHSLKIDKRTNFTLNGFMKVNGQMQFYELEDFGGLNFSLNRQFLDRKLIVSMNLNDAFFTLKNQYTLNQGGINATGSRITDTRRFGINARYNFGIRKKERGENMFNFDPNK
jgi:iron complex outermembrane recepter protein